MNECAEKYHNTYLVITINIRYTVIKLYLLPGRTGQANAYMPVLVLKLNRG